MPHDLSRKDRLIFRVVHADYVSEAVGFRRSLPVKELRRMTSVMVVQDGVALTGRIVNSRGLPVAKARVILQEPGFMINPTALSTVQAACLQRDTDADGHFQFEHVETGERQIMVEAPGCVRQEARVDAGAKATHAEIGLKSVEEVEQAAQVVLGDFERKLAIEQEFGPNAIPQKWVMNGILLFAAGLSLTVILWRSISGRRSRRASVN